MLSKIPALFAVLLLHLSIQAQPCLPGGIQFTSQTSVDQFQAQYPNCTSIIGSVNIIPTEAPVYNLHGLQYITSIGGSFTIDNINGWTSMEDLTGLDNVTSIGGSVVIPPNTVYSLHGLENLETVGVDFNMTGNPVFPSILPDLEGLNKLKTVGGIFTIRNNDRLKNLAGLDQFEFAEYLIIENNDSLVDLQGLERLDSAYYLFIQNNTQLASLTGLDSLRRVNSTLSITESPSLIDMSSLQNLQKANVLLLRQLPNLIDLSAFASLDTLRTVILHSNENLSSLEGIEGVDQMEQLEIDNNLKLTDLTGMDNLENLSELIITENPALENLHGLENTRVYNGYISLIGNTALSSLNGLTSVDTLGTLEIDGNHLLENLTGLENLRALDFLNIKNSDGLKNLVGLQNAAIRLQITITTSGLENLDGLQGTKELQIINIWNTNLSSLEGLENLRAVNSELTIGANPYLQSLEGISNLISVGGLLSINYNYSLTECAVYAICAYISVADPNNVQINSNGPDCVNVEDFKEQCNFSPIFVHVLRNGPDTLNMPMADLRVQFTAGQRIRIKLTDAAGMARFSHFLNAGPFSVDLPDLDLNQWSVTQTTQYLSDINGEDSVVITLLMDPLIFCPQPEVNLVLPSSFRGCLVESNAIVSVQNSGTVPAETVQVAVVIPPVMEVLEVQPAAWAANGDTLFFNYALMRPFEQEDMHIRFKTRCDTFLLGQTLCWEVFAEAANLCPVNLPAFSEIRLSAQCINADTLRFTLHNKGDAPTQAPHEYIIFRNADWYKAGTFSLPAGASTTVDIPADGATYRMEATRSDDGTRTATALENCGGLTPGQINAFWLDDGPAGYTIACREVIAAYDPNQKSAVPTGAGPWHVIEANSRLEYTIDFQNTGTDTAYRVQLIDVLPAGLDVSTFRPGASSHPCSWEIRGSDTLEVLFYPIALPDSNVNEPASQGFFNFDIQQLPDMPQGTVFENTASIVFDFNPPIITNTVTHRIGNLTVYINENPRQAPHWRVYGNPTRDKAVIRSNFDTDPGPKLFELFDVSGRLLRQQHFAGYELEFQRAGLPAGYYIFRITGARNQLASGKLIVTD